MQRSQINSFNLYLKEKWIKFMGISELKRMRKSIYGYLYYAIILLTLVTCTETEKEEIPHPFEIIENGYQLMNFISNGTSKSLSHEDFDNLQNVLKALDFEKTTLSKILVGNNAYHTKNNPYIYQLSNNSEFTLYIENPKNMREDWDTMRYLIDRYSGIDDTRGIYYLKLEPEMKSSLNATFRTKHYLLNVRSQLSFEVTDVEEMTKLQREELSEVNEQIVEVLKVFAKNFATKTEYVNSPYQGRRLSSEERTLGFVNFWTEVKYNFAFFDQVPDLDWDYVLYDYLPKIQEDQSNLEYYRLMQMICSKLKDGHTNIYLPKELQDEMGSVPLELTSIEDEIYITNMGEDLDGIIQIGSSIVSVDGIPVEEYLFKNKYPFISSSTNYIKREIAVATLLDGKRSEKVQLELKTIEGKTENIVLERVDHDANWIHPKRPWKLFDYRKYNNISYISLNSFGTSDIYKEFEEHLDTILKSDALVIDLRENGGGNSSNGYEILRYLASKPFLTSKWKTREHRAAHKAWGSFVDPADPNLGSWDSEVLHYFEGNRWFESGPDTIRPYLDKCIDLPIAFLTGHNTASAAEDFLIAAESISLGTRIGDYTYGSTGQPLVIRLPGGGSARICTKKDTYPDGREFVGYGIKPDFAVNKSLADILDHKDSVLEFALDYLADKQ